MNTFMFIAIAIGGALGSVSRYGLNLFLTQKITTAFPIGIFSVNVLGSILMGISVALFTYLWGGSQTARAFFTIGFLGAFTTFSIFSLDVLQLIERQAYLMAFIYTFGSVLLSIGGVFLGFILTRIIIT